MNILFKPLYMLFPAVIALTFLGCRQGSQDREERIFSGIVQQRTFIRAEVTKALAAANDELSKSVYRAILTYHRRSAELLDMDEQIQDMELLRTNLIPDTAGERLRCHALKDQIVRTKQHYLQVLNSDISDEGKAKLYMLLPALQEQISDLEELEKYQASAGLRSGRR